MSRIASAPVALPSGVEVKIDGSRFSAKGPKGELAMVLYPGVRLAEEDGSLRVSTDDESRNVRAMSGTTRALVNNIVLGVASGFEKKLTIVGVGYRAKAQGKKLELSLGFSHPVVYDLPEGITAETPTQTEIVVRGADKQLVGQVAAEIRHFRPPEPYKGKGIRYADEHVRRKQAKKT
ncbi:MAG: 50S ribosomal protein L6 [Pseudomonadota bacterium]|nr:50S ribosomal protein L6 [Pseudomonadota bacterium]